MQGATFLRHFLLHTPAGNQRKNPKNIQNCPGDTLNGIQLWGEQRHVSSSVTAYCCNCWLGNNDHARRRPTLAARKCVYGNSKNSWNSVSNSGKGKEGNWKKTAPSTKGPRTGRRRQSAQANPRASAGTGRKRRPSRRGSRKTELHADLVVHAPRPTLARATADRRAKPNE